MKIYIASSVKNEKEVLELGGKLREVGHEVDMFCEARPGRKVFRESDIKNIQKYDTKDFLEIPQVWKGFKEDKKWIDWSDCVIMLLPCGRSAHLELGYALGKEKLGFIYGDLKKGETDVMHGFANDVYRLDEFQELLNRLKREDNKLAKALV